MYDISLKRKWDAEAVRQAQEEDRQELLAKQQALEAQRQALEAERQALEQSKQALEQKQQEFEEAHASNLVQAQKEALSEALAEGERKKAIESARVMKKDGLPIEQIIRFTELSAEDIEKL